MQKILVTGAAGFIGFHTSKRLLEQGDEVLGIDNLNDYYDPNLKKSRLALLEKFPNFTFHKLDIQDKEGLFDIFEQQKLEVVIHLAAQAGVRYSITNPDTYIESNIIGFHNILESIRKFPVEHLIYASSSSVYGGNQKIPFSTNDSVDHPISLYAATKKSNELMAHTYSHLYNIPVTGLRFFTVYGPWGRPDMALSKFAHLISQEKPIDIYNKGEMKRDFTYIDDVIEGIDRLIDKVPIAKQSNVSSRSSMAPYQIFNIGSNKPISLLKYISTLEECMGKIAKKNLLPMQQGDMKDTYAEVGDLIQSIDYSPATPLKQGIKKFVDWFTDYYSE